MGIYTSFECYRGCAATTSLIELISRSFPQYSKHHISTHIFDMHSMECEDTMAAEICSPKKKIAELCSFMKISRITHLLSLSFNDMLTPYRQNDLWSELFTLKFLWDIRHGIATSRMRECG